MAEGRYKIPSRGDSANELMLSASMWRDIVYVVNLFKNGGLDQKPVPPSSREIISLDNTTDEDFKVGEVMALKEFPDLSAEEEEDQYIFSVSPATEVEVPEWHTSIGNVLITQHGVSKDEVYTHEYTSSGIVRGTMVKDDDLYVMPDPDNPRQMKSAESGIFLIRGHCKGDFINVDFTKSQNLWRYELTEDSKTPSTTKAKLLRLDGDDFTEGSDRIDLSDPDGLMEDQGTGDKGWCIHVGNKFYAIQAACS